MNPAKVRRDHLERLTDLPNIGPSIANDLQMIGIESAEQLCGKQPLHLFHQLCQTTGIQHDPCVLDVFMSITSFMDGGPAKPWWDFTPERKKKWPTIPAPERDYTA